MRTCTGIICLTASLLMGCAGNALSAYTNVVNGSTNILTASFLVTDLGTMPWITETAANKATNAVAWAGLTTRTDGSAGQQQTKGAVEGLVSFLCGHPLGSNGYSGVDLDLWSGNNRWRDLTRYRNPTHGGLIIWDYDLSAYLSGKDIGDIPGQSQFLIKVDYSERRPNAGQGLELPFFISYNDGAGLTLDTTVTTNETPAVGLTYSIVSNPDHFVKVGTLPNPPVAGIRTFDITDHILASTDKVFRIVAFVTEYYGDVNILNDSGIVESMVDPEKAPPYMNAAEFTGSDVTLTWYSTTNRTYALETATDLAADDWTGVPGYTNIQGGHVTTTITNPVSGVTAFVRVFGLPPATLFPLEDFESGAPGWVADAGAVWELGTPTFGPTNTVSGTNAYGTRLGGPYPKNADAGLLSPVIDLTGVTRATLSYWEWVQMDSFGSDTTQVYVRDASGNALAAPLDEPIVGPDAGMGTEVPWTERVVSLPPEAFGQQITLEFNFKSDSLDEFAGWYIDDVMILEQ